MTDLLVLEDVHTYYSTSYVLQGLSLRVAPGTVVGLVGRNGMGKTTAMRSVIGFTPARRGKVWFKGEEITRLAPHQIARKGLGIVPQGRRIFPSLTVEENLAIASRRRERKHGWDKEKVFSVFPRLGERIHNRGNQLSGGEQQMLAVARALVSNPDLVLMDEPSEGLAPLVVREIARVIAQLKEEGVSLLLAEQNLPLALEASEYLYVIDKGKVVFEGTPQALQSNPDVEAEYLAV